MAAPAEHQTKIKGSTFTNQREECVKRSNVMHLQQRLQELKKRERQAQQHNKLLLLQFERAQDTLREMLAHNAAMKTIRMEYERYLEENSPRWQQQLQEKTQAAQKKRMEDCLRSYLKNNEEKHVWMSTVDRPLLLGGPSTEPQRGVAPQTFSQENSHYNQDGSCYCPYTQSSCMTPSQSYTGRFPGVLSVPHQSHGPSLFPPPNLIPPQSYLHQHLTSTPARHQLWSSEDAAGWNHPGLLAVGLPPGSLDRLCTEEPVTSRVSQTVEEEEEEQTSGSPSSNTEKDGGGKSCLSPDLDVKPVRLSSNRAESNESGRDSSLTSRQKKKERRVHSSSDSEICDSQKTSGKSIASLAKAQSSERNCSSEDGSRTGSRRTRRLGPEGSPQSEGGAKEQEDEESQHIADDDDDDDDDDDEEEGGSNQEVENQSHDNKLESCGTEEESGRKTRDEEEPDDQEGGSSEQSSIDDKDEERKKLLKPGGEEEKENSQKSDEEEDDEVSTSKKTTEEEEEEEDGVEDWEDEEESRKLKNRDSQVRKEASSQDEDEDGSEKIKEEEEAEESEDSEDIIFSPQDKRSKQMQMIPEEGAEEEEEDDGGKTQSSNEFSEEEIENLLTPQEQTKEKKHVEADGKPKATCHNMSIFQVSEDKSKTDRISDSDEFDHFYD